MQKRIGIGLTVASVLAVAGQTQANHSAAISSNTQYVAEWEYVPDFDQRRALLPNTGRNYCVPTSALNWMTYIAHHGHPSVMPGDAPYWSWMQAPSYNPMTSYINTMGTIMSTDENTGTNGNGAVTGLNAWLFNKPFVVFHFWTHGNTTITFSDIAGWTLNGAPVMPSVGWYDGEEPNITRDGGHALSVTRVARSGAAQQIQWRDPADDNITFSQSVFTSQSYACDPRVVLTKGAVRVMDKVVGYGSGYIDGMTAIVPLNGLTVADDSLNLTFLKPVKFSWDLSELVQEFDPQFTQPILDVKYIPGSHKALALLDIDPATRQHAVYCVDAVLGEVDLIGTVPSADSMQFGRFRDVYFLTPGGQIVCYPLSEEIPWDVQATAVPPEPVKAVAYDDATDTVLGLSDDGTTIYQYPKSLAGDPVVMSIPATTPAYPFEPDAPTSMTVSPMDGSVFITNEIADGVLHVMELGTARASSEVIGAGDLVNPRCVQVGDNGAMTVVSDDALTGYLFNDETGGWAPDATNPFNGMRAGACLEIIRSRNNFDPAEMPDEEFRHVLPEEFAMGEPDCRADLDGDGDVDGEDLAGLLALWMQPGDVSDLNGDGTTDGMDLAALLAAWGACP